MCELSAPTDSASTGCQRCNKGILPVPASGHPAGRQRTLEAGMTSQAGSLSYGGGQAFVVAHLQSQVENLRHRIQTHTPSV